MPGLRVTRPAPELPAEHRFALVVATTRYADATLQQLRAPAHDAAALSQILADPRIGAFEVTTVIDRSGQEIRLAAEEFLTGRSPQDLLVVYLSCHGLIDLRRRLYFAASDTVKNRLAATGVESQWLLEQMEDCRARRQVVILDCCFSGAFTQGAKGDTGLGLGARFHGQGRGRVVLTASRASEYSFEGEPVPGSLQPGSVFTSALLDGIRSGAADLDNDGYVSVDEAYAYAFDHIRANDAQQSPQRWLYGAEGKILLARSPVGVTITPAPLPEALRSGLDSPHPAVRLGAVHALGEWLASSDPSKLLTARQRLREIADSDIPRVAEAAHGLLASPPASNPSTLPGSAPIWPSPPGSAKAEHQIFRDPVEPSPHAGPTATPSMSSPVAEHNRPTPDQHATTAGSRLSYLPRTRRSRWLLAALVALLTAVIAIPILNRGTGSSHDEIVVISGLAFSPDGKTLASTSGSNDGGAVQLWDSSTGKRKGKPISSNAGISPSVAFSPDGKTLASGSDYGVQLLNPITGKLKGKLRIAQTESIHCMAFSPDGKVLATGSRYGAVWLWDLATGKRSGDPLTKGGASALEFSPDGKILASASSSRLGSSSDEYKGDIRLWDPATGKPKDPALIGRDMTVGSLAFSPDGETLASDSGNRLHLWDPITGKLKDRGPANRGGYSLVFNPDGKTLATGSESIDENRVGTIRLWDAITGDPKGQIYTGEKWLITKVAFSPDGKILASGSIDGTVRLWDSATGDPI